MFIQNVSLADIEKGWHYDAGLNSLLIQIVDPDMEWPTPLYPFKDILKLKFLDIEEQHEQAVTPEQIHLIYQHLNKALKEKQNVVVHCVAGICRSGAIAEIGVCMGFDDTETYRQPNLRVKSMLMKYLNT